MRFLGLNDAGTPEITEYARISTQIVDASDGAEIGLLKLTSAYNGVLGTGLNILGGKYVGINTAATAGYYLSIYADTPSASSWPFSCAHIYNDQYPSVFNFSRYRGTAGQDNDGLFDFKFHGANDNATPEDVEYARISTQITDASDGMEEGALYLHTTYSGILRKSIECNGRGISIGGLHSAHDWIPLIVGSTGYEPSSIWHSRFSTYYDNANAQVIAFTRFRSGSTPAQDNDYLTNLSFYGYNDAGTPLLTEYARISNQIINASDGEEGGALYLKTMASGILDDTLSLKEGLVGLGTTDPATRLDISDGAVTLKVTDEEPNTPANDCVVFWATASGTRGVDREISVMLKFDNGEKAVISSTVV